MKTNISLRSIAALLLIAVPSISVVSCTDDEDLADLSVPETTVTVPAEEWDILGPTSFEKVGPDVATASQIAKINEEYKFNTPMATCSPDGRRKIIGTITLSAIGSTIAKTALDQVKNYAKDYAKKKATGFAKKLFGIQEKKDSTMIKINMINSQVGEINNKLDEMTTVLINVDDKADNIYSFLLNDTYQKFNSRRMQLAMHNEKYISRIAFEIEKDSVQAEEELPDILSMWANATVGGNAAYNEAVCYAKEMCQFNVATGAGAGMGSSMNLCTLYDKIVYDSFPWENLGYESREQFRALQALQSIQGLELAYLYCSTMANCDNTDKAYYESQMNMIQNAIQNVHRFFEINEIVRHEDKAICQIKGSHFEMDIKGSIQPHPALTWKDGKPCAMKDTEIPFLSGERSSSMSDQELKDAKSHCLSMADADRMKKYFDNYLGKNTSPRDWFTLAGIDMTPFSDRSHIVTSDSYTLIGYNEGLGFGSFSGDIDLVDIEIRFKNLVRVDLSYNPDKVMEEILSGSWQRVKHDSEFTMKALYGNVEKKNAYKTDEIDHAWHTIKIKNSKGLTFDPDFLTLTLNRIK
ncbi:MAG: hypothetical protein KBS75_08205 [Bacteroidales bacterium]|nr:hypothetical protein [Candidatus Equimonas faecalis]